jgi:hypothetical protein
MTRKTFYGTHQGEGIPATGTQVAFEVIDMRAVGGWKDHGSLERRGPTRHDATTGRHPCARVVQLESISPENNPTSNHEEHSYDGRERNGLTISRNQWARSEKDLLPHL